MSEPDFSGLTALGAMAAQMHEVYVSFVEAGFTKAAALELIGKMLQAALALSGGVDG